MSDDIKQRLVSELEAESRHNTDSDQPMPTDFEGQDEDTIRQVGPSPAQDSYSMRDAYAGETQEELGSADLTGEEDDPGVFAAGSVSSNEADLG